MRSIKWIGGLLGKKVGETAVIKTPGGELHFEVLDISF